MVLLTLKGVRRCERRIFECCVLGACVCACQKAIGAWPELKQKLGGGGWMPSNSKTQCHYATGRWMYQQPDVRQTDGWRHWRRERTRVSRENQQTTGSCAVEASSCRHVFKESNFIAFYAVTQRIVILLYVRVNSVTIAMTVNCNIPIIIIFIKP